MSRRTGKRYIGNFAMLPDEVLTSDAGRTLPHPAMTVLAAIAAQFYGKNNGSLTLPRGTAAKYGVSNPYTLDRAQHELEERGLVLRTKPGSRLPPRAPMFALTWRPIDEPNPRDPHDAQPTLSAPNQWAAWIASKAERHWTVPESEKRVAEKQRARQPRDTRACSPGIHESVRISSPGIHAVRSARVAQGYGSDISGVGAQEGRAPRTTDVAGSAAAATQTVPSSARGRREGAKALELQTDAAGTKVAAPSALPLSVDRGGKAHLQTEEYRIVRSQLSNSGLTRAQITGFLGSRLNQLSEDLRLRLLRECVAAAPADAHAWLTGRFNDLRGRTKS